MLSSKGRTIWKRMGTLALVLAVGAFLVLSAGPASAKRPPPEPPPPVDTGTIYFALDGVVHAMNPDGSGKTPLHPDLGWDAEPSKHLHGGLRWFLQAAEVVGETCPHGRPRYELFAVSETGTAVQLNTDPTLEPSKACLQGNDFVDPRWADDDFMVSWVALRWVPVLDEYGEIVDWEADPASWGIYAAEVSYDAAGDVAGLAGEPFLLPVELPLGERDPYAVYVDVEYDWSPDTTAIVCQVDGWSGLYVADVATGVWVQLTPDDGFSARWSPDGSKIVFKSGGGIDTINPDGSDRTTVIPDAASNTPRYPHWSPNSTHLTYDLRKYAGWTARGGTKGDICRAAADGSDETYLTKDTRSYAANPAWLGE